MSIDRIAEIRIYETEALNSGIVEALSDNFPAIDHFVDLRIIFAVSRLMSK